MEQLTVETIQQNLKDLLRSQIVLGTRSSAGMMAVSVAKAACRLAGIPEEEIRSIIEFGLYIKS